MGANRNIKCRSKKHTFGGCGDPRCPEGLHLQTLFDAALKSGNLDAVFDHAERARLKPGYAYTPDIESQGFTELGVYDPKTKRDVKIHVTPMRQGAREIAEAVDRSTLHDFENLKDFQQYVRDAYQGMVVFHIYEDEPNEWNQWGDIHVSQITIDADLRGLGIASHLKTMLTRYADKKGYLISGTPTNKGDGTTIEGVHLDHVERAIKHRERLVKAYYKHGYVDNPCWTTVFQDGDWLTKDFQVHDRVAIDAFTPEAQRWLNKQGQYIRFPNGKVPAGMLRRGGKFDATSYRAPAFAPTREEADRLNEESFERLVAQQAAERSIRKAKKEAKAA